MNTAPRVVEAIGRAKLVPVLRLAGPEECVKLGMRILESGLELVEIAATTPGWRLALKEIRGSYPDATIGVGTVLNHDDAKDAVDGGADFLVSPHLDRDLRQAVGEYLIEGGLTPGEVFGAARYGLAKLFPAHVGGTQYLRSLLAVYPSARIMPTGGLKLSEARDWLAAGAYAVGIGSGLFDEADPAAAVSAAIASA